MKPQSSPGSGFQRQPALPLLIMVGMLLMRGGAAAVSNPSPRPDLTSLGGQSIRFEQNLGQAGDEVRFVARGPAYYFSLSSTEATVSLRKFGSPGGSAGVRSGRPPVRNQGGFCSVRLQFVGADPQAEVSGEGELPGRVNYFLGGDAAGWRAGASLFARVRVTDLYPGINLVHYGNQQHLEYDFEVAPGADPSVIAIRIEGADRILINPGGDLVLTLGDDEIRQPRPVVYQTIGGRRKEIEGAYLLLDSQTVKFTVGDYDRGTTLVIDPVLSYSTYFGGTGLDAAWAVAVDPAGFVYVAGETMAGLPVTGGTFTNQYGGAGTGLHGDAFVAKFDSSLSNLVYLTYVGGAFDDVALGLAVDAGGSAYITGYTDSQNFPLTNAIFSQIKGTPYPPPVNIYPLEAFVTKLGPSGANLIYSTYLGGGGTDLGFGIATDPAGNAYVAGFTQSSDFPTANVSGNFTNYSGGYQANDDAFVAKLGPSGTNLVYSMYLGGTSVEWARDVAADAAGQAYVTGFTLSQNFPVTTNNAVQPWLAGAMDAFVTVVAPFGSNLVTSTYLGGAASNQAFRITLDAGDNIYLTGVTASDAGFPASPGSLNPGGVFKSVNAGTTWGIASDGLPATRVFALAVDPTNPLRLYAGTTRGLARSPDAGVNWFSEKTVANHPNFLNLAPYISVGSVFTVAVDPVSPGNVYAGTAQGVFKSTDAGLSWSLSSTGLAVSSAAELAIAPTMPVTIYSGGASGVYYSTNDAATWEARNNGLGNLSVNALAIHPTTSTTLYVATAGGVYQSTNRGASWTAINAGLNNLAAQALAVDPVAPATLYVGTAGGVFKSVDAGTNWTFASTGLTTSNITALAINPLTPATLYAGTTNGLFKSTDGAQTWSPLTNGFPLTSFLSVAINPQSPDTIYAGLNGTNFFGGEDAFVMRLGGSGFSTVFGGTGDDEGGDVAVDSAGRVHLVGVTTSKDLPTLNTAGFLSATNSGGHDVFIAGFAPDGKALLASAYLGGAADDLGYGIAVNAAGTYIVGETASGNFPTLGALQGVYQGARDAFIARIADTVLNPVLNIQSVGSQVRLSWSALAVDYHLQSNTNLLSASGWINVPASPVETNGVLSVTVPATSATQFFRLTSP